MLSANYRSAPERLLKASRHILRTAVALLFYVLRHAKRKPELRHGVAEKPLPRERLRAKTWCRQNYLLI